MTVLVTGAAGLAGRTIVEHLSNAGIPVTAQWRRTPLPAAIAARSGVTVWQCDLATLDRVPDGLSTIIHAAATSPIPGRPDAVTIADLARDNALASARLAAAGSAAKVRNFIYLSSLSIHGPIGERAVTDATPIRDPNGYGLSKLLGEQAIAERSFPASAALRLPAIIGSGATRNWTVQTLAALRAGKPVRIYNPEAPFNNVVHADDIAAWILGLLRDRPDWRGYRAVPLGCVEPISMRAAVETLADAAGLPCKIVVVEAPRTSFSIDLEGAARLGWRPMRTHRALSLYSTEECSGSLQV